MSFLADRTSAVSTFFSEMFGCTKWLVLCPDFWKKLGRKNVSWAVLALENLFCEAKIFGVPESAEGSAQVAARSDEMGCVLH